MMAEIIHMSQEFVFSAGMGVWGKDGTLSALPHVSTVETLFHDSSSDLRPRLLRIDSPLSSIR